MSLDLPKTLDDIRRDAIEMPTVSGLYFLFLDDDLVYIGRSMNVFNRFKQHVATKVFNRVSFVPLEHPWEEYWEAVYIAKYHPLYNQIAPRLIKGLQAQVKDEASRASA